MRTELMQIRRVHNMMASYRYPLDHVNSSISVAEYAMKNMPNENDLSSIVNGGNEMLGNLLAIYMRIVVG